MGYSMSQQGSKFFMKTENKPQALKSLKENFKLDKFKLFEDAIEDMRWEPELDEEYNVIDLQFSGTNCWDDFDTLNAIAPFVEKDSYIEMLGEDGDRWRWNFDGEKCVEKHAKVSW
jgi:hypothetical protein